MTYELKELDQLVLTRVQRLNGKVLGTVTGLTFGLAIFFATNWLILKGGPVVGPHLALLGQFFIGYRVSFIGSLIGLTYGFAAGFITGYAVTIIYNYLVTIKDQKQRSQTPKPLSF